MCTAANYKTKDHYFGRTFDYEISYGEQIVVVPRNYPFLFRKTKNLEHHYAMIGIAAVVSDYPLYYDATNEKGLSVAGLNFPGNAYYEPEAEGKDNLATFELIPWILGQCGNVEEAVKLLKRINITNAHFNKQFPPAQLHWIVSDRDKSITVEPLKDGLKIYDNPVEVLTNNPPFDMQMFCLNNYRGLSAKSPKNNFAKNLDLEVYTRGMGAMGLPGDLSSMSRFVKVAFTKMNSISGDSESESVSQFFHILGSVEQQRGCVILENNKCEMTIYTSCCNTDKGIYYYTTYENNQISAVDMHRENLEGDRIVAYPLLNEQQIYVQNEKH